MSVEYEQENGVFLRTSSIPDLEKIDSIILDIDGVILDVTSSFREAISRTAQFFFTKILRWTGKAIVILPVETQFFKQAGGFNNDWELTYVAVLFFLAKSAQFDNQNLDYLKNRGKSVKDFCKEVAVQGGGLDAAQKVLFSTRKQAQVEKITSKWDKAKIKQIFQEIYGGIDYCRTLYGFKPEYIKEKGLINQEVALIKAEDLQAFYPKIGIITGRTVEEARIALDFAALESMISKKAVLVDDGGLTKPDPRILMNLGEILGVGTGIFIGDTVDDLRTVTNYQALKAEKELQTRFLSGLITQKESEKKMFFNLGADIVAENPGQMLDMLSRLRKRG